MLVLLYPRINNNFPYKNHNTHRLLFPSINHKIDQIISFQKLDNRSKGGEMTVINIMAYRMGSGKITPTLIGDSRGKTKGTYKAIEEEELKLRRKRVT
jgi:hypothetical protein